MYSYQHGQLSQCRRETSCYDYRPQRLVSEILRDQEGEKNASDKMEKYLYQIHLKSNKDHESYMVAIVTSMQ
jgi:hypothetical protein